MEADSLNVSSQLYVDYIVRDCSLPYQEKQTDVEEYNNPQMCWELERVRQLRRKTRVVCKGAGKCDYDGSECSESDNCGEYEPVDCNESLTESLAKETLQQAIKAIRDIREAVIESIDASTWEEAEGILKIALEASKEYDNATNS